MAKIALLLLLVMMCLSCNNNSGTTQQPTGTSNADTLNPVDSISTLIRQNPQNAELFNKRSQLFVDANNLEEAINDLEISLKVDTSQQAVYIRLSELYLLNRQSEKAKDVLFRCISRYPASAAARVKLAQLYFYVQMYTEAMTEIVSLEFDKLQNGESYFVKALILKEMDMLADAVTALKKSIEYDSKNWEAYNLLGEVYLKKEDTLAMSFYKSACDKFPDNAELFYNAGVAFQHFNRYDEAESCYLKALDCDSLLDPPLFNLGVLYLENSDDYVTAISWFTKAIACDTANYAAYYNRGCAYEAMGNLRLAEADFRHCLQLSPNYELAVTALNEVIDKRR